MSTTNRRQRAPSSVREQKKQAARAEILEVARELIESKGYRNTRMREIAKAARISYQTLYNYFPAKSLIVQALLDAQREDAAPAPVTGGATFVPLATVMASAAPEAANALDRDCNQLRTVIERALDAAAERQRGLWREVVLDALRQPSSDYVALTMLVPDGPEALRETVRNAHADGSLVADCSPEGLAQLICRIVDSNLLQLLVQPDLTRREVARVLTEQLEMLLRPYLVDEPIEAPRAGASA